LGELKGKEAGLNLEVKKPNIEIPVETPAHPAAGGGNGGGAGTGGFHQPNTKGLSVSGGDFASSEIKIYNSLTEKFGEGYKSVSVARGAYVDVTYGQNLNATSKGVWQKVFEAGYLNGQKIEVHYFYNSNTGQYANPFIRMGEWGSKAFKGLK
jgi:hypothetical protein